MGSYTQHFVVIDLKDQVGIHSIQIASFIQDNEGKMTQTFKFRFQTEADLKGSDNTLAFTGSFLLGVCQDQTKLWTRACFNGHEECQTFTDEIRRLIVFGNEKVGVIFDQKIAILCKVGDLITL